MLITKVIAMSMLDMLEKEINKLNLFEGNLPDIVKAIADSIPSQTIPYRMKIAIAISEIVLFISQFRINIQHWNRSIIPINSIMFCIAKSGASKDSSVKAARKCFTTSYNIINELRKEHAIEKAKELAEKAGCDLPDSFACYKNYYMPPNPLFVAISTTEGFIQHLNDLSNEELGAGYIFSGEIGAELASNMNLTDNIKILAETYDEGNKEVKMIKTRETQSKEIKSFPVSALFLGSQDNLLFDADIKRKFKTEFTTKLARRSFFIFVKEDIISTEYNSIKEMIKQEELIENIAIENRDKVSKYLEEVTSDLLNKESKIIPIDNKVRDLFTLYKRYNEEIANTISSQYPISKLTRTHLQWKALKLAGALSLIQGDNTIHLEDYKAAIEFVELINNDIFEFEKELVKESYEAFVDYMHQFAIDNEFTMSLHELRKAGFISTKVNNSGNALKELVKLANSYDEYGLYELDKDYIKFKELIKSDKVILSYLACSGTKQQRAVKCSTGFQYQELNFSDLEEMLKDDYVYSPFKFKNGIRGKDNIISGCKWIVLDIDSGELTDEEAHLLISDINHFIVRTSDKSNPYKFRVLIELDTEINISDIQWKPFIQAITKDLGFTADALPKSQVFFSYKDREILSVLNQEPLNSKQYLNAITDIEKLSPKIPNKKICSSMLEDPLTTFDKAFNAKDGEGRRKLIWACRYARELGADRDYCKNLLKQITSYWVKSFPEEDLEAMFRQLDRWVF